MRRLLLAFAILLFSSVSALADLRDAVNGLGRAKLDGMEAAIKAVAAEPGDAAQKVLDALGQGNLYIRKSDGQVFIAEGSGTSLTLTDPVTGQAAGDADFLQLEPVGLGAGLIGQKGEMQDARRRLQRPGRPGVRRPAGRPRRSRACRARAAAARSRRSAGW